MDNLDQTEPNCHTKKSIRIVADHVGKTDLLTDRFPAPVLGMEVADPDHPAAGGSFPGKRLRFRDDLLDRVRCCHGSGIPGDPHRGNCQVHPEEAGQVSFSKLHETAALRGGSYFLTFCIFCGHAGFCPFLFLQNVVK